MLRTAMVVAPMLAPLFGGMLEENYGWRAVSHCRHDRPAASKLIHGMLSRCRDRYTMATQIRGRSPRLAFFSQLLRKPRISSLCGTNCLGKQRIITFSLQQAPFVIDFVDGGFPSEILDFGSYYPAGSYKCGELSLRPVSRMRILERNGCIDTALVLPGLSVATLLFS